MYITNKSSNPSPFTVDDWSSFYEIIGMVCVSEIFVDPLADDEMILLAYNVRDEAFYATRTFKDEAEYENMYGPDWVQIEWGVINNNLMTIAENSIQEIRGKIQDEPKMMNEFYKKYPYMRPEERANADF